MNTTLTPRARLRTLAGGTLWCAGWAALAACAVLPALNGTPQAVTWALAIATAGMTLIVLAPANELHIARPIVLAAPASATAAWLPALQSMPFWLVAACAAAGTGWCAILAVRMVRAAQAPTSRSRIVAGRPEGVSR